MRVLVSGGGGVANQSRESEIHARQVGDRTRSGRDMLIKKKKKYKKKRLRVLCEGVSWIRIRL